MKKIFFLFGLLFLQVLSPRAQITNDGFITNQLSVDLTKSSIVSYISGVHSGITNYKNGGFTSVNDVYVQTGINLEQVPGIGILYEQSINEGNIDGISSTFLHLLKNAINKVGNECTTVGEIRNEFLGIVNGLPLNDKESEAMALIDMTVQTVVNELLEDSIDQTSFGKNITESENTLKFDSEEVTEERNFFSSDFQLRRLPRWFRCGLGTIGSAIIGGLTGIGGGFVVGGPLGAVVGGVVGVISGAVTGIAAFCD